MNSFLDFLEALIDAMPGLVIALFVAAFSVSVFLAICHYLTR